MRSCWKGSFSRCGAFAAYVNETRKRNSLWMPLFEADASPRASRILLFFCRKIKKKEAEYLWELMSPNCPAHAQIHHHLCILSMLHSRIVNYCLGVFMIRRFPSPFLRFSIFLFPILFYVPLNRVKGFENNFDSSARGIIFMCNKEEKSESTHWHRPMIFLLRRSRAY